MSSITNECGIIDSRDIEKEIVELEKRLRALKGLENDYPGGAIDWLKGVTLIRVAFAAY